MFSRLTNARLLRSLRHSNFALLWSGQTLSRFGDHLYEIALAWWVLEETGSAAAMATVLIFAFGPTALLSLVGGVLVDRYPRLQIMLVADLLRGGAALAVALLAFSGHLQVWQVYALSITFGIVDAFFQPAYAASVPDMVSDADLPSANSLTSFSIQFGRIAGPAIGAAVVAIGGINLAFLVNAVTFFLAAVLLLPLLKDNSVAALRPASASSSSNLLPDFREGLRTVLSTPWIWVSILVYAAANITLSGPYAVSLPFLVESQLGAGVGTLGILYALFAAGYLLGGLWLGNKERIRGRGRLIYLGLAVAGLMLFAFGLPIGLIAMGVAALINGVALELGSLAWTNTLQELVPRDRLGRVAGIEAFGSMALVPIGFGLAGWATEALGPSMVFALGGGLTVIVALLGFSHPGVRQLN